MGKDIKKKHSITSPLKYRETFFLKKALHGGTNVFEQNYGGMLYKVTTD